MTQCLECARSVLRATGPEVSFSSALRMKQLESLGRSKSNSRSDPQIRNQLRVFINEFIIILYEQNSPCEALLGSKLRMPSWFVTVGLWNRARHLVLRGIPASFVLTGHTDRHKAPEEARSILFKSHLLESARFKFMRIIIRPSTNKNIKCCPTASYSRPPIGCF